MLLRTKNGNRNHGHEPAPPVQHGGKLFRWGAAAGIVMFATLAATYQLSSQTPKQNQSLPPLEGNAQMAMPEQNSKKANFDAANLERKRQIADDSAKLLKLAGDLKSEVDKTSKDTLSVGVIRKAEEIEKLAHNVKEKMKLTMGGN